MRTTIEWKKETIAKFENCVRVSGLAAQYNMVKSTYSTFLKNTKEAIKTVDVVREVTIVHSKQRPLIIDEVEKLLLIWIKEKELDGDSIREGIICEKTLCIYADLLEETLSTCAECESWSTFNASRGWFKKLKYRRGIHGVVRHGEAVSSNKEAAEKYAGEFRDFANAGGYLPHQVANETGLFLKDA